MYVERIASLLHVRIVRLCCLVLGIPSQITIYLNSLCTIALLCVQLPPVAHVNRLHEQCSLLVLVGMTLLAHDSLTGRVEAEIRLSHQLLIKRRVDSVVEVLPHQLDIATTPWVGHVGCSSTTSFEKFR